MLLDGHKKYIMKVNWVFLLILLVSFTEKTTAQQDALPDNTSITGCSWHWNGHILPLMHSIDALSAIYLMVLHWLLVLEMMHAAALLGGEIFEYI